MRKKLPPFSSSSNETSCIGTHDNNLIHANKKTPLHVKDSMI